MDLKENELSFSDYEVVARLHCYHLSKGFLATLGVPFLALLYEAIDKDNDSVLLVKRDEDNIVGFVTGGTGLGPIYKQLLLKPLRLIYSLKSCFLSISKLAILSLSSPFGIWIAPFTCSKSYSSTSRTSINI